MHPRPMDDTVNGPSLRWIKVDCMAFSLYHFTLESALSCGRGCLSYADIILVCCRDRDPPAFPRGNADRHGFLGFPLLAAARFSAVFPRPAAPVRHSHGSDARRRCDSVS